MPLLVLQQQDWRMCFSWFGCDKADNWLLGIIGLICVMQLLTPVLHTFLFKCFKWFVSSHITYLVLPSSWLSEYSEYESLHLTALTDLSNVLLWTNDHSFSC